MRFFSANRKSILALASLGLIAGLSAFEHGPEDDGTPKAIGSGVPVSSFTNFESAHVSPIAMTPDGTKLLAVNTANNSLEVFTLSATGLMHFASIPVGLDPVTVRARTNNEAWVVCTVSDEVSIVDLTLKATVRSLTTKNEPSDVVFAGSPQKAFVSCAERESILVYNLADLNAAPVEVLLKGEQPRALAVSPDGSTVYCAFFESGNATTVLNGNDFFNFQHGTFGNGTPRRGVCSPQGGCTVIPNDVTNPAGPYGGAVNAAAGIVPNSGAGFVPALNPLNPPTPETKSIIVRKNAAGNWMDDNGGNWNALVSGTAAGKARMTGWDMPDRDVAILNTGDNSVTYKQALGNILMAMSVHPGTGEVFVVGTDATNEKRFEPNLRGKFLTVNVSSFLGAGAVTRTDLNPHINYSTHSSPPATRKLSVGDPRAVVWKSDGTTAYITGMGSNNVIAITSAGARTGGDPIAVGEGPTGIVLHESSGRAFVLNKFGGSISTIDLASSKETARTSFFDPTPQVIRIGRKFLYDTQLGSGHGHISCGSCHVDGRWDRLAWDLGDPSGDVGLVDGKSFHPLKGVKTTQFLKDIIGRGRGNLHWRGDKHSFADFAGAFEHLQGLESPMDLVSMQQFSDFLAATWYEPNPYRALRPETESSTARMNGIGVRGSGTTMQTVPPAVNLFVSMNVNCAHCHNAQTGRGELAGNGQVAGTGAGTLVDFTPNKNMATDLRSSYRKNGFYFNTTECTSGFGLMSEGVMETWFNGSGVGNYLGDYEPELLSWSGGINANNCSACLAFPLSTSTVNDVLPAVGMRHTINGAIGSTTQIDFLKALANDRPTEYAMVVKGIYGGVQRGFYYLGGQPGTYQPDENAAAPVTHAALIASAQAGGAPLTWTLVHPTTKIRHGVDQDLDGVYDYTDGDAVLALTLVLEGAWNGTAMRTDLKAAGVLPMSDPYGMSATMSQALLDRTGSNAPVDWVMVQLRDGANHVNVVDERAALVLANGKVVRPDGEEPLWFPNAPRGQYKVVAWHRNHLAAMTSAAAQYGTGPVSINLSDPALATYGTDARTTLGSIAALWAGDVSGDGVLRYTNTGNDRDPILVRIGGSVPTATTNGYYPEDVNLDGVVRYTNANNDRDPILVNIGGAVPTNTRTEQLP
jgi:DNA-binding beta-propeller fold protein YncE